MTPDGSLLEALLDSWDRNNTILINLLRALPDNGMDARAVNAFDLAVYPTNFDPGELLIIYTHRGGANYTTDAACASALASV